jgi:adenosylcobyric acid synthase
MQFHTLMVQGTTSDAGKSTVVAALCRLAQRDGIRVVPMKPQNMALNSAVTVDGGEIGRAGLAGTGRRTGTAYRHESGIAETFQRYRRTIVVHGKARADMNARDYHQYKTIAMSAVLESYQRLRDQ